MTGEVAELRAGFAAQINRLGEQSELLGRWCQRVGCGAAISDSALSAIAASGHEVATWVGVKKVFAAALASLEPREHALRHRVPTLGGTAQTDPSFDAAMTDFIDQNLPDVLSFLPRMMAGNDPAAGIDMWQAVPHEVGDDAALLVIGAAAGLELVADDLDHDLAWSPATREGVDTHPIDTSDPVCVHWLLGICPPDDVARHIRTQQAIGAAQRSGVQVANVDAESAIRESSAAAPLVVMGASILCMLKEPSMIVDALKSRPGETYFISDEVVQVHRRAGLGYGLEKHDAGDRVIRVLKCANHAVEILA